MAFTEYRGLDLLFCHPSSSGNTAWVPSPLVQAAIDGSCCVLEGVDRIPGETLASLSRLLQDRFGGFFALCFPPVGCHPCIFAVR
jgi:AAA domain (dynein-related subfamily)